MRRLTLDRVWRHDHTYEYDGRVVPVHEEWLLHKVNHLEPAPAKLTHYETRSILGFRWWSSQELAESTDTIFPPHLGRLMMSLLTVGVPTAPIDISDSASADAG